MSAGSETSVGRGVSDDSEVGGREEKYADSLRVLRGALKEAVLVPKSNLRESSTANW